MNEKQCVLTLLYKSGRWVDTSESNWYEMELTYRVTYKNGKSYNKEIKVTDCRGMENTLKSLVIGSKTPCYEYEGCDGYFYRPITKDPNSPLN